MRIALLSVVLLSPFLAAVSASEALSDDHVVTTTLAETVNPLDNTRQPLLWWAPETAADQATPLFVFLHSWSADYRQDNSKWLRECARRNWIWVHPNFRGVNESPEACGSRLARQDILDAVAFARERWKVDPDRIFLAGVSGGGHMSLLMAGHHSNSFSAVSAWVGPTDLAEWHRFHTVDGKPQRYAKMIEASLGGPPGRSPAVDAEYQDRSPVFHLQRSDMLPVSIFAGIEDGHSGSVPVSHSLRAWNAVATSRGGAPVSESEILELTRDKRLTNPQKSDLVTDHILGRKIFLRRTLSTSVVTIFEGGHESIPESTFAWFEQQRRTAGN